MFLANARIATILAVLGAGAIGREALGMISGWQGAVLLLPARSTSGVAEHLASNEGQH